MGKREKSIVLFGTYAEENLGDDLILKSQILELNKRFDNFKLIIFTGDFKITKNLLITENVDLNNIEIIYTGRKGLREPSLSGFKAYSWFFKNIARIFSCKLLIIGPGNQTQDVTRKMRFIFFLSRSFLAWVFRVPYTFMGVGYYQIHSSFLKKTFKFFGKHSCFISTRDNGGYEKIKEIIPQKEDIYSLADVSFTYPWGRYKQENNSKLKIGFTSKIFFKETEASFSKNFEKSYGELLEYITEKYNAELVFFPFYKTKPWDDTVSLKRLVEFSQNKELPITISKFKTLNQLSYEISNLDAVVGVRYHSVLISVQNLTPVMGISYAYKTQRFMDENGLSEYVVNLEDIKPETLPEMFDRLIKNRESMEEIYKSIIERERALAYRHFDLIEKTIALSASD